MIVGGTDHKGVATNCQLVRESPGGKAGISGDFHEEVTGIKIVFARR